MAVVILTVIVLGTVGFDSYNEFQYIRDLNNSIVYYMEQYKEQNNELIDC